MRCRRYGFTVVEIIVVLSILSILSAVAVTALLPRGPAEENQNARALQDARTESLRTGRPVHVHLKAPDGSVAEVVTWPDGSVTADPRLLLDPHTGWPRANE
jgi:prepilin-type N-terminal cleavage/methylation domain-containing protein